MLKNELVHDFIQVNKFEGIKYFNKERIEEFIKWHFKISTFDQASQTFKNGKFSKKLFSDILRKSYTVYLERLEFINKSEYKVDNLFTLPEVKIIKTSITVPKKKTASKTKSKQNKTNKNKDIRNTNKNQPKTKKKAKP